MLSHEFPGELGSTSTPLPQRRSGDSGSRWRSSPWPRRRGRWRTAGAQRGLRHRASTQRSTGERQGSPRRSTWDVASKKKIKKGTGKVGMLDGFLKGGIEFDRLTKDSLLVGRNESCK